MTCTARPIRPETVARSLRRNDVTAEIVVVSEPDALLPAAPVVVSRSAARGEVVVSIADDLEDGRELAAQVRDALEDEDYEVTPIGGWNGRLLQVSAVCEGHESLRGDAFGAALYCDGTIR